MTDFLEQLASGTHGVRFEPPAAWALVAEFPRGARFDDRERGLTFHVRLGAGRLDLDPRHDALLRADAALDARAEFEATYDALRAEGSPNPHGEARTADPAWSALIACDRVTLPADAPALTALYRVAYEPGFEAVVAALRVPAKAGLFDITATAVDRFTGMRESALVAQRLSAEGAAGEDDGAGDDTPDALFARVRLTQAEMDDPAHDAAFERLALARARSALAWLRDPRATGLVVTAPDAGASSSMSGEEVALPQAGCAVRPPPRFRLVPPGALALAPTIATFSRVALGGTDLLSFDVWRVDGARIARGDRAAQLRALALKTTRGWEREGARKIEIDERSASDARPTPDERPGFDCYVRFEVQGEPVQTAMRWFVEPDGAVYRVGVNGKRVLDAAALFAIADEVVESFRRLPDDEGGEPAAGTRRRPWWKLFG